MKINWRIHLRGATYIFNFKIKFKNFIQKAKGTFYNFIMVHILLITCSVFQA